ncbi:CPBP family intramembrane glutamic endopeptidase [Actinomadura kijaniata]|uniref:CPBP family intramembrane glutamic endopeptidase n=1 Tax=Actinomadura kijaniata TaxID=46161 RepID=UPI0008361B82|nr:CPBP family intramembrane glutamic endopeptidase [Actinomadura kijaniata]
MISESRTTSSRAILAAGIAVYALAFAWLLLTGTTRIGASADDGAARVSLWAAVLPPLAALLLTRLVPPAVTPPVPLAGLPDRRLARETWAMIGAAVAFPLLLTVLPRNDLYPLVKALVLLALPVLALRLLRNGGPKARAFPAPVTWLAPIPAAAAWFLLSQVGPLAPPLTQDLPDPVTLAVASLVTFLTASVLEEIFYRGWLQTRLEARHGRWPAIMISSLLFAAMHVTHIRAGAVPEGLATVVAYQGLFGVMQGYLWSRYRNIWVPIAVHTAVNLVYIDLLVRRF